MQSDIFHPYDELLELQAIRAESLGWLPLDDGAYLHFGSPGDASDPIIIHVVGLVDAGMAEMNVLWLV